MLGKCPKVEECPGNCLNFFNNHLESFSLHNFQHRLFLRATTLIHNIVNKTNAPRLLKEQIVYKKDAKKQYNLRSDNQVILKMVLKNHYGEATFVYIFSKLIDEFIDKDMKTRLNLFVNCTFKHFHIFITLFPKLDLRYKTWNS